MVMHHRMTGRSAKPAGSRRAWPGSGCGRCPSLIQHGALPPAAQTAAIIAEGFSGVPVSASALAGDIPSDPDPADLPPRFAGLVSSYTGAERA